MFYTSPFRRATTSKYEYEREREINHTHIHSRATHTYSQRVCILRESFFVGVSVQLSSPTPPQFLLCRAQQSPPPGPLISRHTHTYIHAYIEKLSRLLLKREWKTRKCYNTVIWVKYMRMHLYTFTIRSCFWVRRVIKANNHKANLSGLETDSNLYIYKAIRH